MILAMIRYNTAINNKQSDSELQSRSRNLVKTMHLNAITKLLFDGVQTEITQCLKVIKSAIKI